MHKQSAHPCLTEARLNNEPAPTLQQPGHQLLHPITILLLSVLVCRRHFSLVILISFHLVSLPSKLTDALLSASVGTRRSLRR